MQTFLRCGFLAPLLLAGQTAFARAPDWPRLIGGTRTECSQAMTLAKLAFHSREYFVFDLHTIPDRFPSKVLLQSANEGDEVVADSSAFDELDSTPPFPRKLYWGKRLIDGYRLALMVRGHPWREDRYELYVADSAAPPAAVLRNWQSPPDAQVRSIVADAAVTPRIYRTGTQQGVWALSFGNSEEPLDSWKIWVPAADTLREACSIQFHPAGKRTVYLLPHPVRELEHLLDQTMGSGRYDGSLHSTALLRQAAAHTWGNAALRPWAVASRRGVYNTRKQIDAALDKWATERPGNRQLLTAIRRQYPLAERALDLYYQQRFGLVPALAHRAAAYVLDLAYREHYTFSRHDAESHSDAEAKADAAANPWPSH
ncbi:hypothetical protein GCM10027321_06370 [Massilia terrae]|uniref:Uncharacterized protein n=1 Tax=Massilia terrae TaxID=1811224 RepID=A0ABT2CSP1_9BURK|nr:hypothetical protein [Massilia terrae]MCS0657003.1 hypothetical protein [Massilia terrae]